MTWQSRMQTECIQHWNIKPEFLEEIPSPFIPCPIYLRALVLPSLPSVVFSKESWNTHSGEQYFSKGGLCFVCFCFCGSKDDLWTYIITISCKLVKNANFRPDLISSESESLGQGSRHQYFNQTFRWFLCTSKFEKQWCREMNDPWVLDHHPQI